MKVPIRLVTERKERDKTVSVELTKSEGRGILSFSEDNDWTDRSLVGGRVKRIVMPKYRGYRKV